MFRMSLSKTTVGLLSALLAGCDPKGHPHEPEAGDAGSGVQDGGGRWDAGSGGRPPCTDTRIRKIYAIPSNILLPRSSSVEVEVFDDAIVGEATYTFFSGATAEAEVAFAPSSSCAAGSAACQGITCVRVSPDAGADPETGIRAAMIKIQVTVEDHECRQTESIQVECLQASDPDTCSICMDMIDPIAAAALGSACPGSALLGKAADPRDPEERGCLTDETCLDLLRCQEASSCHTPIGSACYCGELDDPLECRDSAFEPSGACRDETLAAFEAQFERAPRDNADLLRKYYDLLDAPSGFASLAIANTLTAHCLVPDGPSNKPTTRQLLEASGISRAAAHLCVSACLP